MADALTTDGPTTTGPRPPSAGAPATVSPVGEVLRDIARGGIAGILVGIFVAGIGGRLVMRLATILHEDTVGRRPRTARSSARISFNGTMALITFGGLGMGLLAGMIWVIVATLDPRARPRPGGRHGPRSRWRSGHRPSIQRHEPRLLRPRLRPARGRDARRPRLRGRVLDRARRRLARPAPAAGRPRHRHRDDGLPRRHAAGPDPDRADRGRDPARPARLPRRRSGRAGRSLVVGLCTLAWWVLRVRGQTVPPRWLMLDRTGCARRGGRPGRRHEPAAHPGAAGMP